MADKDSRKMVLDKVLSCIVDGTFQPNEKIYSEPRLANSLGIKRSAVREVLVALEIMGVIESRRGEGTFLKSFSPDSGFNPLSMLILLQKTDMRHIMQVRNILEPAIAESCADNITGEKLAELEHSLEAMRASGDYNEASRNDIAFHIALSEAAGNPILSAVTRTLTVYLNYISLNNWKSIFDEGNARHRGTVLDQHEQILRCIAAGDKAKAAEAMRAHLRFGESGFAGADPVDADC